MRRLTSPIRHVYRIAVLSGIALVLLSCSPRKEAEKASLSPDAQSPAAAESQPTTSTRVARGPETGTKARVVFMDGTLTVTRNNTPIAAEIGTELLDGDQISTGNDGQAEIEIIGIATLKLEYRTTLVLDGTVLAQRRGAVSLATGSVLAKVKKLANADDFVIRSGAIVCGVRGTVFRVTRATSGNTNLEVLEGTVSLFPDGLITSGLHPAAELVGLPLASEKPQTTDGGNAPAASTPIITEAPIELAALPSFSAGQSVEVPANAFDGTASSIKKSAAAVRDASEAGKDIPDTSRLMKQIRAAVPAEKPLPKATEQALETSSVSPAPTEKTPDGSAPNVATPDGVRAAPKTERQASSEYIVNRVQTVRPARTAAVGTYWPRPEPYSRQHTTKEVVKAMSDGNTIVFLNEKDPNKPSWSFKEGRVVVSVQERAKKDWSLVVERRERVKLEEGGLYAIEFTAWAEEAGFGLNVSINEGGTDRDKDGDPHTVFNTYQLIKLLTEPHRYRVLYHHSRPDTTNAVLNASFGITKGKATIQDLTITKLQETLPTEQVSYRKQLPNGDFSYGFLYWSVLAEPPNDPWAVSALNGAAFYKATRALKEPWHLQLGNYVSLERGKRYVLSFDAQLVGDGILGVDFVEDNRDADGDGNFYSIVAPNMKIKLEPGDWQRYTVEFEAAATDPRARININLGGLRGSFTIDNVSLAPL